MLPVEIIPFQGTLIIRARGSELLILPQHVKQLKGLKQPKDFTEYFLRSALVNRPARKLFEAWLRKDQGLWKRVYSTIQQDMPDAPEGEDEVSADTVATKPAVTKAPVAKTVVTSPEGEAKTAKKAIKTADKAEAEPKAEKKKVATKKTAAEEPAKKVAKKASATKAPVKKATATKAPAKKTAAKKSSSKSK